jgi:predicted nucleic acid-binding protein
VIVLDASALVELVLGTHAGRSVASRISDPNLALHAPSLADVEVTQVVRRYVLAGIVTVERGAAAIDALLAIDLTRHDHTPLVPRAWALRHNLTAYDAVYVALAEALPAPLLTGDRRLAGSVGHTAKIEVVGTGPDTP